MAAEDLWSKEQVKTLIESFKQQELLWNPRHGNYMKRAQRDRVMRLIIITAAAARSNVLFLSDILMQTLCGNDVIMTSYPGHKTHP